MRAESFEAKALNHKSFCPSSFNSKYWAVISAIACEWTVAGSKGAGVGQPYELN